MRERDARNPQHPEMADESMVRTLAAQAALIWPQEAELFRGYGLAGGLEILDAGCGPGEITARLAELYPEARLVGVDLLDVHLDEARRRYMRIGDRLRFAFGDVLALSLPNASFDLVVSRHVLQSVPDAARAIRELVRVTKPGGRLHLLCEDYHMIHAEPAAGLDPDVLWSSGALRFGDAVGTDLRIGRNAYGHLRRAGVRDLRVDYAVVDTVRSDRETFARMMEAWRDGFCASIGTETDLTESEARAHFDALIASIRDPDRYVCWHVPIWSGVR
jgi:SAM-dependent methyltransferase